MPQSCVALEDRDLMFNPNKVPSPVQHCDAPGDIIDKALWQTRRTPCNPAKQREADKSSDHHIAHGLITEYAEPHASTDLHANRMGTHFCSISNRVLAALKCRLATQYADDTLIINWQPSM
jgi:hypothetical protein